MRCIVVDVENTTTKLNDKYSDFSPYNPNNKLVSIGWMVIEDWKLDDVNYVFINHQEMGEKACGIKLKKLVQDLASCDTVIAHNAKYDVQWLEEAGFELPPVIEDTMIREYVMARGRGDISFRLGDCCERYKVAAKGEIFETYPDLTIDKMPIKEVEDYGRADIQACAELYIAQEERLSTSSYTGLKKTIHMMEEFCRVLATMERNGVTIDEEALLQVEKEFTEEAEMLKVDLEKLVREVMGDTPINLDSPQQLSSVIYSRRVKKASADAWVNVFNIGKDDRNKNLKRPKMNFDEFRSYVISMTETVMKTEVKRCTTCDGNAKTFKTKKDGTQFKRPNKCKTCAGEGVIYFDINEVAGFKMQPLNVYYTTVNGFSTGQTFLDDLILQAQDKGKEDAAEFLSKLQRLSSVSSYLSNFVGGIKIFKQTDNILHPNFNQCITATGRLSSTKPNLQNQPREATFPIRKVFVSRFDGGNVSEVDFSQLEFRAAVHLARCTKGKEDILDGIDVHNQTATIITEAGQPIGRQDAKSRTFKPLYGGVTGTEAERSYFRKFLKEIYQGINKWHTKLQDEALITGLITIETGRQYDFHGVERAWHGGATRYTQIVNYPVQGFATADIVPLAIIRLAKEMKARSLKSVLVLTVHDSIMVDTHPDEQEAVLELLQKVGKYAEEELVSRYNIEMFVPLTVEVKYGKNAMEMRKVA